MSRQAALASTDARRQCTGESHQALRALAAPGAEALAVPAAHDLDQAELEASVFLRICKMGGMSAHPFGIIQVKPASDHLVIRLLDEPYVIRHWVDSLLPSYSWDTDELTDPRDRLTGVYGLRYHRQGSSIRLYRPGTTAQILLTGFNIRWWERVIPAVQYFRRPLFAQPDWTADEHAAHTATRLSPFEPANILSPLLRRIRATAGPGEINSTDAWSSNGGICLETTDGPPCPDLISLLTEAPTGLGWEVEYKACGCLCDHQHQGCNLNFRVPDTDQRVYYSNLRWGRTLTAEQQAAVAEGNKDAFLN